MKTTLPVDAASAITEVGGIAALLDKNGWRAAALIAVATRPGTQGGDTRSMSRSAHGRLAFRAFAKALNAKGWSEKVIQRHYEGWEAAADAGLVPHAADLSFGEKIDLPTEGWAEFYPPRWAGDEQAELVATQARQDGAGASKAVDIAQNPKAMAAAIKASPAVAQAAAQALVEKGDVHTLSRATAQAAQNRQVEVNRKRREEGLPKQRTASDPKPTLGGDPGLAAFLNEKALSEALRQLVTYFPRWWSELPDAAKEDEVFVGVCDETMDKILIALDGCRAMIHGRATDEELEKLLTGGDS